MRAPSLKLLLTRMAATIFLITILGCSSASTIPDEPEGYADATSANTAFGLTLHDHLEETDTNFVYSPLSISTGLAMTYSGARGDTANEIGAVLRLADDRSIRSEFSRLLVSLPTNDDFPTNDDEKPSPATTLQVANSLWVQNGLTYGVDFVRTLQRDYKSEMRQVDFRYAPEEARHHINDWVADRTDRLIPELLPRSFITPETRLVLVNGIYLRALWKYPFDKSLTAMARFETNTGEPVQVPMMRQQNVLRHISNDDFDAVELPYHDSSLSMVMLMPKQSSTSAILKNLGTGQLNAIFAQMDFAEIHLRVPRFEIETSIDLRPALTAMGLHRPFHPEIADFKLISRQEKFFLEEVLHEATIAVDERGTIAPEESPPPAARNKSRKSTSITFDRPFVFFVRDHDTGTVLFIGQVTDPSH